MWYRTSCSNRSPAKDVIDLVTLPDFSGLTATELDLLVDRFDRWLLDQPWARRHRKGLQVEIDTSKPGPSIIEDILRASYKVKIGQPVARHLVGAKLTRRFPEKKIENRPTTEGPEADFLVENTAFHVSVAPTSAHLERCAEDLVQGRQPYLIVPAEHVAKARAFAEDKAIDGKVAIVAIEAFVGQNIDEMGEFNRDKVRAELVAVLIEYNRRVAEVETDQSIQISIAKGLLGE